MAPTARGRRPGAPDTRAAVLNVWDDPELQPALLAAVRRVIEPGGQRLFSHGFFPVR